MFGLASSQLFKLQILDLSRGAEFFVSIGPEKNPIRQ
jgi:hypothetical protein